MRRIIKSCFVLAGESEPRFHSRERLDRRNARHFGSVSVASRRFPIQSMRFGCTEARDAVAGQNETEMRVDFRPERIILHRDSRSAAQRSAKTRSLGSKSITLLTRLLRLAALIKRCDIGQINLIIVKYHAPHTRT